MENKVHNVEGVSTDSNFLFITIDNQAYQIDWGSCSTKLSDATETERAYVEISPSGYGLHWPLIDEDLAITPLLQYARNVALEIA